MIASSLRRTAAVAVLVLALGACSGGDGGADDPLGSIEWSGEAAASALTFPSEVSVDDPVARLVEDGDGAVLETGQMVALDYVVYAGDGTLQFSTYDTGSPEVITLEEALLAPGLWDALTGTHVGARVVYATPDISGEAVDGDFPTVVLAITVSGATDVLDAVAGEAVDPVAGLPFVTIGEDGAPHIDVSEATFPEELVVQPLIVGTGDPVVAGQVLSVHYTGWLSDGTQFDSSWDRGTPANFTLAQGQLIDGWVQGLAGQSVGSRVLLVIPPDLGYGDVGQGVIPAGSTLVFVVDILAAL